jgi:glutamate racemase
MKTIGIFDSGYGGLTVLKEIKKQLPGYSYIYLGDNARAPYGTRSFDTVYNYTLEATEWLFEQGCLLVILACNTASAKALRNIQQRDLPKRNSAERVLGVIRPVTESINNYTKTKNVGLFATSGTVRSASYRIEIEKLHPGITLYQEPCPMWVSLVECGEYSNDGAMFFIKKHCDKLMQSCSSIDAVILACTHYPILYPLIRKALPATVAIINQAEIVSQSLDGYLKRHSEIDTLLCKDATARYCTTDCPEVFGAAASIFMDCPVYAEKVVL